MNLLQISELRFQRSCSISFHTSRLESFYSSWVRRSIVQRHILCKIRSKFFLHRVDSPFLTSMPLFLGRKFLCLRILPSGQRYRRVCVSPLIIYVPVLSS